MNQQQIDNLWKIMRKHNFDFVDAITSEYSCIICKNILINASIAPCGCQFCWDCIKDYLKDTRRKCPGQSNLCNYQVLDIDTNIHINSETNNRISELSVKCPHIDCQSAAELIKIGDHLRICENGPEDCPYAILGCENDKFSKVQVRDHISLDTYSHTKLLIEWIGNFTNEAQSMRRDISKLQSENEQLKEKIRSDEDRMMKFIQNVEKREREHNFKTSSDIQMLNEKMCQLNNTHKTINNELQALKDKQKKLIEQISKFPNEIKIDKIEALKEQCLLSEARFKQTCHRVESRQVVQIKSYEIPLSSAAFDTKSTQHLQETIDELQREFLWKIDNFSEKVKKLQNGIEEETFSSPFLTHQDGYKICLSMRIVGLDWIHFYLHIMKGLFDNALRWPFDRVVQISLIDEKAGRPYESKTIKCSDNPKDGGLQKPTKDRNDHGVGFWFRISLDEILTHSQVRQNDKILVRFSSTHNSTNSSKYLHLY